MPNLDHDLTGKLLIAMPGLEDPRFSGAVVFVCSHAPSQAMGLIINRLIPDLGFSDLLEQLEIAEDADPDSLPNVPIGFGGPVEMRRGFVLHSTDYAPRGEDGLRIARDFAMTATLDILSDIASGQGPERSLLMLGYAGWGAGQLDGEILRNDWLTAEASPGLVFDTPMAEKWDAAIESLGISRLTLSSTAGHA